MKGVTIILMKGYNSKSRVSLNQRDHVRLIDALSFDLYNVILATNTCNDSWDCLIASPDRLFSERCKKKNISVLDLISGELNSIFRQIQNWAVEEGYDALILCAGDIPLLQGDLIDKIKEELSLGLKEKGKSMVVCPSKGNGVSVIAMSPANLWMITARDGVDNLQVIKELNRKIYPYQILKDFRSYLDLDQQEDLFSTLKFMEKNPVYKNRATLRLLKEIVPVEEMSSNYSSSYFFT